MSECCDTRPNFGRPTKLCELGNLIGFILTPLKASNGAPYYWTMDGITYENFATPFVAQNPEDRIYGFPRVENIEYVPADSQKEEAASGRTSFLRKGKISFNGELWDKDAMPIMEGKLDELRCMGVGVLWVTSENKLIGQKKRIAINPTTDLDVFMPIPLDEQSIDPRFVFKLDATTQKVMFTFDLDRNFKAKTYYSIDGNALWDETNEVVRALDFTDPPQVIDCILTVPTVTTTGIELIVNDDFRNGSRYDGVDDPGNVTGLSITDFRVRNITDDSTVTPSSVTEDLPGQYSFTWSAQTAGDRMSVEILLSANEQVHYYGITEFVIPA